MIAEKTTAPRSISRPRPQSASPLQKQPAVDVLGALWRYKWAVILPALAGFVIGFLIYVSSDNTYRSTAKLRVDSNRPAMFDAISGEVVGAVVDIKVLEAELLSDTVAEKAFTRKEMQPFHDYYEGSLAKFTSEVKEMLELEPEVTEVASAQTLITLLHFDSDNQEHCEAAVQAYSDALQEYYNEQHQKDNKDLESLIEVAIGQISPELSKVEQRYSEFRITSPLHWDSDGNAINPYRETQKQLTARKEDYVQELRREETVLAAMKNAAENSSDPRIALSVLSNLLGVKVASIGSNREPDPLIGDSILATIDLEKQLVPLVVEKTKNVAQYGPSHPTVKAVEQELEATREELLRLVTEQAERISKLRKQWYDDLGDPTEQAEETIKAVLATHEAKIGMLKNHITELEEQISKAKIQAGKISQYEYDNLQMLREIEQYRDMLQQLEENMGKVQLTDDESVTQVVELAKPSKAYIVGPLLIQMGGIGTLVGLLLGGGLAILLEKNANTFRDPEEITDLLGVPTLTHIPFFRGKRRKIKKGEVDPFKTLSTDLAVVHQPSSMTSEAIRSLRTAVFFDTNKIAGGKVLQITSPLPGDGKSTIACNLAASIAQSGKRVLAIDCDLRRPQLTDNFDCDTKVGLTNVLNGECDPLDAAHSTPLAKLSIMPCGPIPSNPAEALSLPVMNELLDYLRDQYDYIILDTPPLLVVTDPSITASMADALILTLRVRRKSKPNARDAINILNGVGANVLGTVINNSDESGASDGYRGYGYYRHGTYGGQYYRRNGQSQGTSVSVATNGKLRRRPEGSRVVQGSQSNGVTMPSPLSASPTIATLDPDQDNQSEG